MQDQNVGGGAHDAPVGTPDTTNGTYDAPRGMGPVGGGASTPHYGTPISRNGTHDAPGEIGTAWGTLDAPIWHLWYTGEWDVEAPSPTVGIVHGGTGRP